MWVWYGAEGWWRECAQDEIRCFGGFSCGAGSFAAGDVWTGSAVCAAANCAGVRDVTNDLLMIGFSVFGMFCEIAGLNFFRMMEKKFDFTTLLAVMVGLFDVPFLLMFGTLGLVGAVDLIRPGARIGS